MRADVFETRDASGSPTVSTSQGSSVRRSMTSQEMPSAADTSTACDDIKFDFMVFLKDYNLSYKIKFFKRKK